EQPEPVAVPALPVALRHAPPVRPEPPRVGKARADDLPTLEKASPAEDRMLEAQANQPAREGEQLLVGPLPVEPRELVVLAPGVVVSALRWSNLVAGKQHWHALRERERDEEVAPPPAAKRHDLLVVGLAFDARVPGAVVVRAVPVLLEVRIVVLLVV